MGPTQVSGHGTHHDSRGCGPRSWPTGVVLVAAGVVLQFLSPSPLRVLVVQFLYGALDSHPFFPSHAASGCCFLTAAVPCDVISMVVEPSSWRTGVVLVAAGVFLRFLLPTALGVQVVHHMSRRVSVYMKPNRFTPPRGVLVVRHLPHHGAMPNPILGIARTFLVSAAVVRTPLTRKRHGIEHRPQQPSESTDPTQHAKGMTGDCPGPRKESATGWTHKTHTGGHPLRSDGQPCQQLSVCLPLTALLGGGRSNFPPTLFQPPILWSLHPLLKTPFGSCPPLRGIQGCTTPVLADIAHAEQVQCPEYRWCGRGSNGQKSQKKRLHSGTHSPCGSLVCCICC